MMTQHLNLDSIPPLHRPSGFYALIYGNAKLNVPVKPFLYRNSDAFTSAEDFLRQPGIKSKNFYYIYSKKMGVVLLPGQRPGFPNQKMMNQLIPEPIFSNLGLGLSCRKIRMLDNKRLNFERGYPIRA